MKPGAGNVNLLIPDPIFTDIKGTLQYTSGPIANPPFTVGQTAMGATASGTVHGSHLFAVGFKQVALFRFRTVFYAGLKDSDGCIEETTTGMNFTNILDGATDQNLRAAAAPFYMPRQLVPNGQPFKIEMADQPGGRLRLQRRNQKRDRLNFLVALRSECGFLCYFVVERLDGSHQPIEGFRWHYHANVDVAWVKGQPTVSNNNSDCRFDTRVNDQARQSAVRHAG